MKILLVQPASPFGAIAGDDWFLFEPLALEYLAAAVPDDEVRILDLRLDGDLCDTLETFQPDLVGATAYTVHVNTVKHLCETVKQWNADAVTVVGGHHATVAPDDFADPAVDLTVVGEGVVPFREIVSRLKQRAGLEGIPGVAVSGSNSFIPLEDSVAADIDALPQPARRLTAAYRSQYFCDWMRPLASIRTSKGCPYRCKFCALWKLTCGKYIKREPRNVVDELGAIEEENVFFADDESLLDSRRMQDLAGLIREAGIEKRYFLYGRSDTIARNPDLLRAWKEIGLTRVFVGLEFFRDEDLEYVGKGSKLSDNEKAVGILQDLEIDIYASMILRPDFEKQHFKELRRYCRALRLDYPTFAVLTPLPGTDLYDEVKHDLITDNYDYFDFIHTLLPTRLPLKQFYKNYAWLINTVLPPGKKISFLRRFPVKELGSILGRSIRVQRRVRNAWKDYEASAGDLH
ncbi:MAG: cobalamin-dependent protein [Gemmatimonadota bacterium]|nr:MAG: cobalamin-dependent protein [Gemmatimonadota bacterium]